MIKTSPKILGLLKSHLRFQFFHPTKISEISLLIIASSPHRDESFRAIEYIVSELKKSVPIWKKEYYSDGERWIGSADKPN